MRKVLIRKGFSELSTRQVASSTRVHACHLHTTASSIYSKLLFILICLGAVSAHDLPYQEYSL